MKTPNHHRLSRARIPQRLFGRCERGFTMVELMLTVTVLGILLAAGVPSFRSMITTMRIKNASFDFYSSILVARNEAMTRNTTVTITPQSGTNWATGWNVTTSSGAVTLKTQDAFTGIAFIPKVTPLSSIVYNSSGRLNAAVPPISLNAAGATAQAGRCVTIDLSGRPVTTKGVCP